MSEWVLLIDASEVPEGRSRPVQHDGRWYAVCNDGGRFHVLSGVCPHAGAVLGGGAVRDGCLICPRHRWPWDLRSGMTDLNLPDLRVQPSPCKVEEGKLYGHPG